MAFFDNNQEYPNRKDRRKQYRDSRRFDRTCRNHGSCPWCAQKRKYKNLKREAAMAEQLKDLEQADRYNEGKLRWTLIDWGTME